VNGGPKTRVAWTKLARRERCTTTAAISLGQEHQDFELIVSDNTSTDETPAICSEYAGRDERTRFHR
jgi:hypothetical protein